MNWNKLKKLIRPISREAVIWTVALVLLAMMDTEASHATLCPLSNLGFDFCPGCGLGRSIAYLFQGEIYRSLSMHPLGIVAVPFFIYRIISLSIFSFKHTLNQ
ncbi:MAG: DUF2752 domain-containing protein [Bacteroidota bacterium]